MELKAAVQNETELRSIRRTAFLDFENILINATDLNGNKIELKVVDFSVKGALVEGTEENHLGQMFANISLYLNEELVGFLGQGKIVRVDRNEKILLAIHFERNKDEFQDPEKRSNIRLKVAERFAASVSFDHPIIFDEKVHLWLADVSATGASLFTSRRNGFFVVGMTVKDAKVFLPTIGEISIEFIICSIEVDTGEALRFGVNFKKISKEHKLKLEEYLVGFAYSKSEYAETKGFLRTVKDAGFSPKYIKKSCFFEIATSLNDFKQLLEVRRDAYARAGKVSPDTSPRKMLDDYDSFSTIFVAKHHGKVIGSVRVTRPVGGDQRFELEASITLPEFVNKQNSVEISRLCICADFENTDVILGLIEKCTEYSVKSKINYVITSCTKEMLTYYRRLGFFPNGLKFRLQTLNQVEHYFLVHDSRSHRYSYKMNPIFWYFSYSRVVSHLQKLGYIENTFNAKIASMIALTLIEVRKAWLKIAKFSKKVVR